MVIYDNYIVILVFVVSVTVSVHLVRFKLIANKTGTLASTHRILQMGPQIKSRLVHAQVLARNMRTFPRFSSRLKRSTLEGDGDKSLFTSS